MYSLPWIRLGIVFLGCLQFKSAIASDELARAQIALNTLQTWYNTTSGLWDTCGWWNGANCMTVIADLAQVDSSVGDLATGVFQNTLVQAPAYNPNPGPENRTQARVTDGVNAVNWLDSAYDDDGWWALAWIAAYDVTKDSTYLTLAQGIFANLAKVWGTRCGNGGIYWSTTSSYVNAITNELFLSVAAHLANRASSDVEKEDYVQWAQKQWTWFSTQDFFGPDYTINDGLLDNCQNNKQTVWSYNQGVILGGLVELNRAAPNQTYLDWANRIAQAAINKLADANLVIHDVCEPHCAPDGTQFKGIFIRNLKSLQMASPNAVYQRVITSCADSIWTNDRKPDNELGVNWAGPVASVDASTHSSALDALIAAIGV
ncbi:Mannan endo-1,6-alpha-mannosidase [Penicillium ucsense]|uniref:Mannan endo-1,6-alpha-mannosidase n=1 Tax=Penicillium ucsense TaxID=2839758 RepID=A0A8J8WA17_9EURO|nr:Mannan endo-1,6-alpha-mannosidase [Penicillium ucsense]KAF7739213.1 Mannan endo-1,6-alpha-mannosidase [Penicillium ucsense]